MTDAPWYADIVTPALLRHARRAYGEAMRRALEAAGYDDIPANGLYIIGGLALSKGEAPLSGVIESLALSKQAAGQLVDTLVVRGYLDRAADSADRRRFTITLTERGKAAAAVQGAARDGVDAALVAAVGPEVVAHARQALAALIVIARKGRSEGPEPRVSAD